MLWEVIMFGFYRLKSYVERSKKNIICVLEKVIGLYISLGKCVCIYEVM